MVAHAGGGILARHCIEAGQLIREDLPDTGRQIRLQPAPGRAYERYCAAAQTTGRPVVPSSALIAAPSPEPPKRKPHRKRLRPKKNRRKSRPRNPS